MPQVLPTIILALRRELTIRTVPIAANADSVPKGKPRLEARLLRLTSPGAVIPEQWGNCKTMPGAAPVAISWNKTIVEVGLAGTVVPVAVADAARN
jgi:hypothetical protein